MEGYAKLWSSVIHSSLWRKEDLHTRLVFVTMLAMADAEGYVGSSVPGIADAANVSLELCQDALQKLESPDAYSRNPANEGRRIKKVHRGWIILNYKQHRDGEMKRDRRRQLAKARQKKLRNKRAAAGLNARGKPRAARDNESHRVTPHNGESRACNAASRTPEIEPLSNQDLQARVTQTSRKTLRQAEAEALNTTTASSSSNAESNAEREATARTQARCWISAECPSFLRSSGIDPMARLILRLGREDAIRQVQEVRANPNVGNPFAYLEAKLDKQQAQRDAQRYASQDRPQSKRHCT